MKIIQTQNFKIAANETGDKESSKIAILMPGRLDTKDYANFTSHADYLAQKGFYVISIDPPGTWDSPGNLNNYTTTTYVKVIDELIHFFDNRPTLLLGHSRGGATAMLASKNPAVIGLVMINASYGPPSSPEPNKIENGLLPEFRDLPPGNVRTEKQIRFDLPLVYFEDGAKHNPFDALSRYNGPKLLIHSHQDEFTDLARIKEIFDSLPEPKMFLEIDGKHDYRLYPEVIESVNEALGQFLDKHLPNKR